MRLSFLILIAAVNSAYADLLVCPPRTVNPIKVSVDVETMDRLTHPSRLSGDLIPDANEFVIVGELVDPAQAGKILHRISANDQNVTGRKGDLVLKFEKFHKTQYFAINPNHLKSESQEAAATLVISCGSASPEDRGRVIKPPADGIPSIVPFGKPKSPTTAI